MTRQLQHLEGELVTVTGRRTRASRDGSGTLHDLWTDCRIWRWDGERALPPSTDWEATWGAPAATVDHLWVPAPGRGIELLECGWQAGYVHWYRRAGGSVDLGFRPVASTVVEEVIADHLSKLRGRPRAQQAATVRRLLNALQRARAQGVLLATSAPGGTTAVLQELADLERLLQRSADAEARAAAGALVARGGRGKPTGLDLQLPASRHRRRPCGITAPAAAGAR